MRISENPRQENKPIRLVAALHKATSAQRHRRADPLEQKPQLMRRQQPMNI